MSRPPLAPGRWGDIVPKQMASGVWLARATYRDYTGKIIKPEARGPSKHAARTNLEDKLHAMAGTASAGVSAIGPTSKMNDALDEWLRERRQEGDEGIRSQSLIQYENRIDNHLRPGLGSLRVQEVSPVTVNRLLAALHAQGKYATARQVKGILQMVMAMCVRYGAVTSNPVRDAAPVRRARRAKEVRTIALDDIQTMRTAVRRWEERPALRGVRSVTFLPEIVDTMLGTGIRIGECLALREADVDLDSDVPTLTVNGTVARVEVPGQKRRSLVRQPNPKTSSSVHTVTLPDFVVVALRAALDLALDGGPDGLIFPSAEGTPRSPGRVREQLRQALDGTGVTIAPHDFRRTVGTLLGHEVDAKTAAAQLGHSSEAVTLRHYIRRRNIAPDVRDVLDLLIARGPAGASGVSVSTNSAS